jgi:hypothetical protein
MKTRYLPSTLLAASSAGFVLTSASAAAPVSTPLQVQTTVESHGPHLPLPGQAYGQRGAAVASQDLNGVQCNGQFASVVDSGVVAGGMRIFAGQPGYDLPGMSATKDVGSYLQFDASNGLQQVDFSHAAHANAHYGISFAFGDFDGDARGDYAVGAWGGDTVPGWVRIGFGRGASQILSRSHFGNAPLPFADNFGSRLMAGDFDGDRQQDLIISESRYPGTPAPDDQGAVLIARGSYLGNLQPVHTEIQVAPAGASTWLTGAMAAIDADSNGSDEVFIGNHSGEINAKRPPLWDS